MTMETTYVEIRRNEALARPLFAGSLVLRDALASYSRLRWPANTAKQAAKEWGLTIDEGKGVVLARASQTTIDKILRSPNGGWAVVLPIMGAVIGHGVDEFLQAERKRHVQEAQRHRALVRDLRALGGDRRLVGPERPVPMAEPARSFRGRTGE